MANKLLLKRSNVASNQPSSSDLDVGEICLNMADAKIWFRAPDVSGSADIRSISGGGGGSFEALNKYKFTATNNQTAFSGADDASATLNIGVGREIVTLNGIVLEQNTDYTATTTTITLSSGATLNDELNIYAFGMISQATIVEMTSSTGSAVLPSGTTAERDSSPEAGYIRWNSTDTSAEVYDGSAWTGVGSSTTFPFYKADGTSDTIAITSGQFPFYKADGTQDNIGVS